MKSVLIIAAEASSTQYAVPLILELKKNYPSIDLYGVGNQEMEKLGFRRFANAEDIAVMGLVEGIKILGSLRRLMTALIDQAKVQTPDLVILMDYPEFNFRLAKNFQKFKCPIIYYAVPQVWAWRKGRIKLLQKFFQQLIVLFPFELDFYKSSHLPVQFFGHPVLDLLDPKILSPQWIQNERARQGISPSTEVLGLMPGSRKGELSQILQQQLQAASIYSKSKPHVLVLLLIAPGIDRKWIEDQLTIVDFPIKLIQADPFQMISITDKVICASGTATLMVALLKKPMVVIYRFHPVTVFIARRFMKLPQYFSLVNLLLKRKLVTELFQEDVQPEKICSELNALDSRKQEILQRYEELRNLLGQPPVTKKVADYLIQLWNKAKMIQT